ncbi:MAG: hypothetical protein AAB019_02460 [Planctomycetota bacterium]
MKSLRLFVIIFFLSGSIIAQEKPPLSDEITRLIEQLGVQDWQIREAATYNLWSLGEPAEPFLKAVQRSDDPEVRMRVNLILKRITYGVTPEFEKQFGTFVIDIEKKSAEEQLKIVNDLCAAHSLLSLSAPVLEKIALKEEVKREVRLKAGQSAVSHLPPQRAISLFKCLLKEDPQWEKGYIDLGQLYETIKESNNAIGIYQSGLNKLPQSIQLFYRLGALYEFSGDNNRAFQTYLKGIIACSAQNTETLRYRAEEMLIRIGHLELVRSNLLSYLAESKETVPALRQLGEAFWENQYWYPAYDCFVRSVFLSHWQQVEVSQLEHTRLVKAFQVGYQKLEGKNHTEAYRIFEEIVCAESEPIPDKNQPIPEWKIEKPSLFGNRPSDLSLDSRSISPGVTQFALDGSLFYGVKGYSVPAREGPGYASNYSQKIVVYDLTKPQKPLWEYSLPYYLGLDKTGLEVFFCGGGRVNQFITNPHNLLVEVSGNKGTQVSMVNGLHDHRWNSWHYLCAFEKTTGQLLWKTWLYDYADDKVLLPLIDNQVVLIYRILHNLIEAIDIQTGQTLWTFPLNVAYRPYLQVDSINRVLYMWSNTSHEFLVVDILKGGEVKERVKIPGYPCGVTDNIIFFIDDKKHLFTLDRKTQQIKLLVPDIGEYPTINILPNKIILLSNRGKYYRIDYDSDNIKWKRRMWETGDDIWHIQNDRMVYCRKIMKAATGPGGYTYRDNLIYLFDVENGQLISRLYPIRPYSEPVKYDDTFWFYTSISGNRFCPVPLSWLDNLTPPPQTIPKVLETLKKLEPSQRNKCLELLNQIPIALDREDALGLLELCHQANLTEPAKKYLEYCLLLSSPDILRDNDRLIQLLTQPPYKDDLTLKRFYYDIWIKVQTEQKSVSATDSAPLAPEPVKPYLNPTHIRRTEKEIAQYKKLLQEGNDDEKATAAIELFLVGEPVPSAFFQSGLKSTGTNISPTCQSILWLRGEAKPPGPLPPRETGLDLPALAKIIEDPNTHCRTRYQTILNIMGAGTKDKEILTLLQEHLEAEIPIDPNYPESWVNLAACYGLQDNKPEMLKCREKAYELNPTNFDIQLSLVTAYQRVGEKDKAEQLKHKMIKENEKGINVYPADGFYYDRLARLYLALNLNINDAIQFAGKSVQVDSNTDYQITLAQCYLNKGDKLSAGKIIERLLINYIWREKVLISPMLYQFLCAADHPVTRK